MGNSRFVYITGFLTETVTDSQIINWLELYQRNGIAFDLVIISGLRPYFRGKASRTIKLNEARKRLNGKTYDLCSVKPELPIHQVIVFGLLLLVLLRNILSGSTIVIQVRTASVSTALKWLKAVYPKIRVIYDIRGASAEEYVNQYISENVPLSDKIVRVFQSRLNRELALIGLCDKAFSVSGKLRDYFLEKKQLSPGKFLIVPCLADEDSFFYDESIRVKTRRELGIADDNLVLLYSGGLDKSWQIPEFIFGAVSRLKKRNRKIFFMCLTPHEAIANELINSLKIEESEVWIGYVNYKDINRYLNAADIGLLFREDDSTNNVASPTKFAEYLMAGLPTVLSQGVGDLSDFVAQTPGVGVVVDNHSSRLIDDIDSYLKNTVFDRSATARIGKENFSKKNQMSEIIKVFETLLVDDV
jgi:glycosyltransferase involved in cell wall biosynthesis